MSEEIKFEVPKTEAEFTIPEDVFPVPCGERDYTASSEKIFPVVGTQLVWFSRNGRVYEIVHDQHEHRLEVLTKERAVSELERIARRTGHRIARLEIDGDVHRWRSRTMPLGSMETLLQTEAARKLPPIRQLVSCPVLVEKAGGGCEVLGKGYHGHGGGTYVTAGAAPQEVPIHEAIQALLDLHKDFAFVTESDKARTIAAMLCPALKMGGIISCDFPIDVAEATESQSGKDFKHKLHSRLYNAIPSVITPPKGGVGSLDETISKALMSGASFICLSNFRGRLESAILEAALRGQGHVECRALRTSATVDTRTFNWQLSTNGAEFTRDLANRSIISRIRKQPVGYAFQEYPEGDVVAHVTANQPYYLGCIFAVIRAWIACGKPLTNESRHDFREWTRAMDWIVQHIFQLPPLLDGHKEEQQRTGNPSLQWLRDLAIGVVAQGLAGRPLSATELVEVSDAAGLALPGRKDSDGKGWLKVGQLMGTLFNAGLEVDSRTMELIVDGIVVRRVTRTERDAKRGEDVTLKEYSFWPGGAANVG